ncbi:MAG: response regulator [Rhodocyclaceae bacterium]
MANILVIEDNPENLELMTFLLQAFGHATTPADDGEQGLAALARQAPDLIVSDIHLPGIDGYEVARRVKNQAAHQNIPLVAVTALAMVGDRDKVLAAGFDGYISKPIDPRKFVEQVESFLGAGQRSGAPPHQPAPAQQPAAVPVQCGQAISVLVVDNSSGNREVIRQTLEPFGYRIRQAGSVEEAMAMARAEVPSLIVSDLNMPGKDGFAFIQQVKADPCLAAVPFVFISASVYGDEDSIHALELGAVRFIARPIGAQALLDEVAASLAGSEKASQCH